MTTPLPIDYTNSTSSSGQGTGTPNPPNFPNPPFGGLGIGATVAPWPGLFTQSVGLDVMAYNQLQPFAMRKLAK